ncbi:hypothetical protein HELRODRAFT_179714 [Helobdella robusta]|uniref:Ig-like domain-containing protein n=1 Tax=Helobdella robusta TaxID=6412 RepID=T1FF23_HELRO|nr:hypothetical protein HELRODRAFT_179714 [Helobdella robusta]ESN95121.1 hypothetical protein HELRODRAFT_179714 [Helobdella robusta]
MKKTRKVRESEKEKIMNPTVTVGPGEKAVMKCRVENLGTKTLTWRKENEVHPLTIGNHPFAPDSRMSVDHNARTSEWSLSIMDVKPSDEGTYRCQISTKNGNHSQQIKLIVKTIKVTGDEYLESGNTIKLMCNVSGKPEPPHNLEWYKEGRHLAPDARNGLIITKKIETRVLISVLTITNSDVNDSGEYTCQRFSMNFANRWVLRSALNFVSDGEVVREGGREFQRKSKCRFSKGVFNMS